MRWTLFLAVPGWMEYWAALCGLVIVTAGAGALIHKGFLWMREAVRAFLKPWTEYPQQIKALQQHDAAEDERCQNHHEPLTPGSGSPPAPPSSR